MPRYEITSPEGKKFEVNAPEGATQEEVMAYAKTQFSNTSPSVTWGDAPVTDESIPKSLMTGAARAAVALPGLPGTMAEINPGLHSAAKEKFTREANDPEAGILKRTAYNTLEGLRGLHEIFGEPIRKAYSYLPSGSDIESGIEKVTGKWHDATTRGERTAEFVGGFVPFAGKQIVQKTGEAFVKKGLLEAAKEGAKQTAGRVVIPGLTGSAARETVRTVAPDSPVLQELAGILGSASPSIMYNLGTNLSRNAIRGTLTPEAQARAAAATQLEQQMPGLKFTVGQKLGSPEALTGESMLAGQSSKYGESIKSIWNAQDEAVGTQLEKTARGALPGKRSAETVSGAIGADIERKVAGIEAVRSAKATPLFNKAKSVGGDLQIATPTAANKIDELIASSQGMGDEKTANALVKELTRWKQKLNTTNNVTQIQNELSNLSRASIGKGRIFDTLSPDANERRIASVIQHAILDDLGQTGNISSKNPLIQNNQTKLKEAAESLLKARTAWSEESQKLQNLNNTVIGSKANIATIGEKASSKSVEDLYTSVKNMKPGDLRQTYRTVDTHTRKLIASRRVQDIVDESVNLSTPMGKTTLDVNKALTNMQTDGLLLNTLQGKDLNNYNNAIKAARTIIQRNAKSASPSLESEIGTLAHGLANGSPGLIVKSLFTAPIFRSFTGKRLTDPEMQKALMTVANPAGNSKDAILQSLRYLDAGITEAKAE